MIENSSVKSTKDLVEFVITSICDGDLRLKIEDVPDILDNNKGFDVDEFVSMLVKTDLTKSPSAEIQNSAMLFIELVLKGNLTVTQEQLNRLADLIK